MTGQDWFGQLPRHWESGNIRRFAAMKTGHTPSRTEPEYWENASIPWFTLADIWQLRDGTRKYLGETANMISELGLANSAAELLPAGTVVFSRTASVGFSGIMPRPMATSQDFWNWVCAPNLMPEYLLYVFRAMQPHLRALMTGSTHKTIYQADAASLRIPVPPLNEQRVIADYLNAETVKIDTLITKQQQLIETLRERRFALVVNVALRGVSGYTRLIDSDVTWIGPVPSGWEVDKLLRHTRIGNGSTPRRENAAYWVRGHVPWLNSSVVNLERVTAAEQFVTETAVAECHLPMVAPGSVLVGLTGQGKTRGMATLLEVPSTVNQHLAYVTPRARWEPRYLMWMLRSAYSELRRISEENGSTKGGLTCGDLGALPYRCRRPANSGLSRITLTSRPPWLTP